jgi:hypothetical protein
MPISVPPTTWSNRWQWMIGVDRCEGSLTAVALDDGEQRLGALRVRSADPVARLLGVGGPSGGRMWAIEGAGGLGYLLAYQLVAGGEWVVDVPAKLAAGCGCWPPGHEQECPQRRPLGGGRRAALSRSA